jgi:GR25 family glycosyltransferase involved in LPS biosynthesis
MIKIISFFIIITVLLFLNFSKNNLSENYTNSNSNQENNVFNDFFDKIIYINLDHRKDRKEQILNEFNKMDINKNKIHRIDAVHEKYNGHIGCAKSHIKALNYAKGNNYKNVVIFEDDFIFTKNKEDINSKLNKFLKEHGNNWDVVQLTSHYVTFRDGTKIPNKNDVKNDNNNDNDNSNNQNYVKNDVSLIKKATTSSSYMINNNFFDKLINNLNSSIEKMEQEMVEFNKKINNIKKKKKTTNYALDQHWHPLQQNYNWYLFYPFLGKQGGEAAKSSIMSNSLEGFTSNNINFFNLKL